MHCCTTFPLEIRFWSKNCCISRILHLAPGSQPHSETEGRKEASKEYEREGGGWENGIRNIYRQYLYVQSSAHSIARGTCWQHINHNTLLNKRTVFVAGVERCRRGVCLGHTQSPQLLSRPHVTCSPKTPRAALAALSPCPSPLWTLCLYSFDFAANETRQRAKHFSDISDTDLRLSLSQLHPIWVCVCVTLCVCAAHQIKQSQRTAVSCTATKETKNKFALRANELSAGGRQNHREGSEEEGAGQLIHLSRAPAPAARLCVSLSYAFPGETRVCSWNWI